MNACTRCGLAHAASRPCPIAPSLPISNSIMPLPSGTIVAGRFRIERVAHRSGMSTVYQAVDLRNQGAFVALKELNARGLPTEERAEALTWLAREAGMLSTLSDGRLPKLLAAASEDDRHYVAMPFIQGETLEDRVRREGPQPEITVLGWGRELAALLRYLHSQDPPIVHRDLKPANVLLRPDGALALLDLGVARAVQRDVTGTAVGTPGYAPPEQYQGLADERSDLYALGATLHRALTAYDPDREAPFRHPPVRDLNPEVSKETAALVSSLLQVASAQRPATAPAVLTVLTGAMRGAFARAYRPLSLMYGQMLILFLLAIGLATGFYLRFFGPPVLGGEAAAFRPANLQITTLQVLLVFAPGLLTFLPLLRPRLRALARQQAIPRLHCKRTIKLLILSWGLPLVIWLSDLYSQRQGNLEIVPGHAPAAAGLAAGTLLLGLCGLAALYRDLHRVPTTTRRLPARYLIFGALLALLPISLSVQAPGFSGACYVAPVQSEAQSQFSGMQALDTDAAGNLYILDQYGLRERMPNDQFHWLLDFTNSASPYYSATSFTSVRVSPDGHIYLGTADDTQVYELLSPGHVRLVALVPLPQATQVVKTKQYVSYDPVGQSQASVPQYAAMAAGVGGRLYFSYPEQGQITMITVGATPTRPRVQTIGGPHGWQPQGLATDGAGSLYVADATTHSIVQITATGVRRTIAVLPQDRVANNASMILARAADGMLYVAQHNTYVYVSSPSGVVQTDGDTGVYGEIGAVAAIGPMMYVATTDTMDEGLLAVPSGLGVAIVVGGVNAPAMQCDLPAHRGISARTGQST